MGRHINVDSNALQAARDAGATLDMLSDTFGCSRSTIERRLLALPPRRCAHCVLDRDAEIARLREAFVLMEEALLDFMGARP